jgi:replicative DNA helicase
LTKLWFNTHKVDAVLLRAELEKQGKLDEVGGVEYIARILDAVPHAQNARYYAGIMSEKHQERKLQDLGEQIAKTLTGQLEVNEKTQRIQELALSFETSGPDKTFVEAKDVATRYATDLRDHKQTFLPTGFRGIDRVINGISPGEVLVIAARPAMGKSALALDISLNATRRGAGVLFVSLEMSARDVIERAICSVAGVNLSRAKADSLDSHEWDLLYESSLQLSERNLIVETHAETPEKQLALIRQLRKAHNIALVIVDYLQLVTSGGKSENRQQEITTISRKLKRLAVTEQIPIIALSQLNRAVEAREKHRPRLSDLRESGSIEQDADVVLLLHREDYYRRSENPQAMPDGLAEVHIAKNRRGPCGIAKLTFLADYVHFADLTECIQDFGRQDHVGTTKVAGGN